MSRNTGFATKTANKLKLHIANYSKKDKSFKLSTTKSKYILINDHFQCKFHGE